MAKWADLMQLGEIWRLVCHRWRPNLGVTAEELGLANAQEVEIALGTRLKLLPPEFFKAIDEAERNARSDLKKSSFKLEIAAGGLVPSGRGDTLAKKLAAHRQAFNDAVMVAADKLPAAILAHRPTLNKAIDEVAKLPVHGEAIRGKVVEAYPSKDDFLAAFSLDWTRFKLQDSDAKDASVAGAKDVKDTIRTMLSDLRSRVAEKVGALLKLAANPEADAKVPTRSINAAVDVLDDVEAFNASLGDSVLAAQISELRKALKSTQDGKALLPTLERAKSTLQAGVDAAVEEAENRLTGMGRKVVIPDRVAAEAAVQSVTEQVTAVVTPTQLPLLNLDAREA